MRVGQPAYIKSLDFVPLGKMRKEQSGGANETEKVAMRSMLGALGYLAREGLFQFCKVVSTGPKCQTYKKPTGVVRLAKAHTDLALPVCRIPVDQICFVSYGDASGGNKHKPGT